MNDHSVSDWIEGLRIGDELAAHRLWERFSAVLVEQARRRLGDVPKAMSDEEDIAISVFRSICRGAAAGRFNDVKNRDDLWWLLLAVTKQKVVDHIRRETAQKRGGGRVTTVASIYDEQGNNAFALDWLIGHEPSPDFLVMLEEQSKRLLGLLHDEQLRSVAVSRIEGYTVPEIAAHLDLSTRSVERKLQRIRQIWARELAYVD